MDRLLGYFLIAFYFFIFSIYQQLREYIRASIKNHKAQKNDISYFFFVRVYAKTQKVG